MDYDVIVVGAGTAGAVVASRLSEQGHQRVLLLEAGADHSADAMPAALQDPNAPVLRGHNWDFEASGFDGRCPYPMGRVVGGSSAVNGALAVRGLPEDYDEWADSGLASWAWPQVLEHFRRLESDLDLMGPYSGREGPVTVQRTRQGQWHAVQRAFFDACQALDHPVSEHNNPHATGVGGVPRNVVQGRRRSTALNHLAAARQRPNLHVGPGALVHRVLMQGRTAVGVQVLHDGGVRNVLGGRVVLCAGAINTPALLMRSGIGPEPVLREHGIGCVMHLPGVGENLVDHPAVAMWLVPKSGVCTAGEDWHQVLLRYTAQHSALRNDMQLYMLNSVDTRQFDGLQAATGAPLAMALTTVVAKPLSRGRVTLASADPRVLPVIHPNCASDPEDVRRLMGGVRLAWQIAQGSALKDHAVRVVSWSRGIVESDDLLRRAIASTVRPSWHPVGTARMGRACDPMSVVDEHGSVHGCEGLTVADASIMPTIPRAPTQLTCMMIGEKIAAALR